MKMRNYHLIHSELRLAFDEKVNAALADGYVLIGGVAVSSERGYSYGFYQAVAKPETNADQS